MVTLKPIEDHPDFKLTRTALQAIDPELGETEQPFSALQVQELAKQSEQPVRDFVWRTSEGSTRLSEMDPRFLLVVARHCVHRADVYHRKVNFFIDVLTIAEEHAAAHGLDIPETVEEIQALIEQLESFTPPTGPDAPAPKVKDYRIQLDPPSPELLASLRGAQPKPENP